MYDFGAVDNTSRLNQFFFSVKREWLNFNELIKKKKKTHIFCFYDFRTVVFHHVELLLLYKIVVRTSFT